MILETIHETDLTATDEAQISALLNRAFASDYGDRSYYKQRPHLRLVARHDGRIVGHLCLVMRDIRLGEALCPIIGVGDVATDPDFRGAGTASRLLDRAIDLARASPARFMVLFGDRPLYAGHGFVKAGNRLTYPMLDEVRTHGVITLVDPGLMVLPLRESRWDFAAPVDLVGHIF